MKKLIRGMIASAAVVALVWLLMATVQTHTVSEEVTRLRRESRSDIIYLRTRVRELESELASVLMGAVEPPAESVGGTAENLPETEDVQTEAVTVPTHQAPETQTRPETEAPAAAYILTEHNGMIGVFDASGELVRTVNVFVMTLPRAEQQALEVGIPAYSYEEMCRLAELYE